MCTGLAIPLGLLLIALVAYILLLHWRKKNGACVQCQTGLVVGLSDAVSG